MWSVDLVKDSEWAGRSPGGDGGAAAGGAHDLSVQVVFVKEKRARIVLLNDYDNESAEADYEDDCATPRRAFVFGYT